MIKWNKVKHMKLL